jgi:hypothetical protein
MYFDSFTHNVLQGRYQGVDWRDHKNWECNGQHNPFNQAAIDSLGLHPMELMFVKVKHYHARLEYPSTVAALQYDRWQRDALQVSSELTVVTCAR